MNDHNLLVAKSAGIISSHGLIGATTESREAYSQVRVTGEIWKQTRFGQSYYHTQIADVTTGQTVSHSKSTIAAYYRCSCGRVAFHKVKETA